MSRRRTVYSYQSILSRLEESVVSSYDQQVLDTSLREDGAFIQESVPHPVANHGNHSQRLAQAGFVYLSERSTLRGDDKLFDRLLRGIAFQKRWQREDGLIDNVLVNWDSPTATAFTVELLAPVVQLAREVARLGDDRAAEIAESLGEYIRTGSLGAIDKGFHTPNHRWVVCAGLAQAMTLYPDLGAGSYVDSILSETIDINADGEYIERSTGTYNAVCNRCLRIMADHLGRPDLLDPVRRNLDMMIHMFHPDGSIETQMSNRQDRGTRKVPSVADSYFDLAQRDDNGEWAFVADRLVASGAASSWLLYPFIAYPKFREDRLERVPPPDSYRKVYPAAKILRVRDAGVSVTALAENDVPFKGVFGSVELKAFRLGATYQGAQIFVADTFERTDHGVSMTHCGAMKTIPGYDLPVGRPVGYDEWKTLRPNRERWNQPTFDITLSIVELASGFDLRVHSIGGIEDVTFWAEWCFDGPGQWETISQSMDAIVGQSVLLHDGCGVYHRGTSGVQIGPGIAQHRMPNPRQDEEAFRVQMALKSPIDHTFTLRYGVWSVGTSELLPG